MLRWVTSLTNKKRDFKPQINNQLYIIGIYSTFDGNYATQKVYWLSIEELLIKY